MKTADAYIRVSKRGSREGDSFQSPEIQDERIRGWATLNGVTIAETHVDIDQSGGKFTRPGFDLAMERIETGQTGGLLVMNTKRFGRSLLDGLLAIRRIRDVGGSFVAVQDGFDISTENGRLILGIMLSLAEWDLERITADNLRAQERAIERGVHFRAPIGYMKDGKGKPLVPGPDADAIRTLFRMRGDGVEWSEIARRLNTEHPRDVQWLPNVIIKMVPNRAYLGEAEHGQFRNVAAHPALVTPEEFEKAQQPRVTRGKRSETLLRGILRCAGCQYVMKPSTGGRSRKVYRCQTHHGVGRCPSPATVVREVIEEHVEAEFLKRYGNIQLAGAEASDALSVAQDRVAELERGLDEYAGDDRLRDALGHERFRSAVERMAAELLEAQQELLEARRATLGIVAPDKAIWDELSIEERRRVIAEGIDTIFLRRTGIAPIEDRVRILWRGEAPDNLPGRGHRPVELTSFHW